MNILNFKNVFMTSLFAMGLAFTGNVFADSTLCDSDANGPLLGEYENVEVEAGKSCFVGGATINGNFKANGAVIISMSSPTIKGNVTIKETMGGGIVILESITINGNLSIVDGSLQVVRVKDNIIDGNVKITGVMSNTVDFIRNEVSGNVLLRKNEGNSLEYRKNQSNGNVNVKDNIFFSLNLVSNTVDGNLKCKNNDPDPFTFDNTIGGNDKCVD